MMQEVVSAEDPTSFDAWLADKKGADWCRYGTEVDRIKVPSAMRTKARRAYEAGRVLLCRKRRGPATFDLLAVKRATIVPVKTDVTPGAGYSRQKGAQMRAANDLAAEAKAPDVLKLLQSVSGPLALNHIAKVTGVQISSLRRVLTALRRKGLVGCAGNMQGNWTNDLYWALDVHQHRLPSA